ncbi:RNA polymerase sigma factor [Paenibacillus swuensis]|uniref:RNA polymerase sigma factor n=1 Tax=Paenibacillus swuensis TaxID=1178515 RepID=UPI000ACA104F|nr:RNA polymerase sigma factor [Paenibacillus swuensis]
MNVISKIEPYLPPLRLYCRSLAGTDWDTEDLVQDVIAKVLYAIMHSPERPISRSYLFRIAKNAWIDHYRQNGSGAVIRHSTRTII